MSWLVWTLVMNIFSKRFFLKHKTLSDARVVSKTKKEYGLESVSDEWLSTTCWSSSMFGIFIIKIVYSLN